MSLTRTHHATVVGPIRFLNRSNNCRVCKINERRSSLVRTHHAIFVFSSSLRPTKDESRMVCAGFTPHNRSLEVRPGRITKKLELKYDYDCERDDTKSLFGVLMLGCDIVIANNK